MNKVILLVFLCAQCALGADGLQLGAEGPQQGQGFVTPPPNIYNVTNVTIESLDKESRVKREEEKSGGRRLDYTSTCSLIILIKEKYCLQHTLEMLAWDVYTKYLNAQNAAVAEYTEATAEYTEATAEYTEATAEYARIMQKYDHATVQSCEAIAWCEIAIEQHGLAIEGLAIEGLAIEGLAIAQHYQAIAQHYQTIAAHRGAMFGPAASRCLVFE